MYGFQRVVSFKFDKMKNGDIILINTMQDRFHDIMMEVIVDETTLSIKDIKVDFRESPTKNCPKIKSKIDKIIGIKIEKGMTRKIMEVLGGSEGCSNLRNMLLSSLPIVLNIKYGSDKENEQELLNSIHENLIGTCIGYSEPLENSK